MVKNYQSNMNNYIGKDIKFKKDNIIDIITTFDKDSFLMLN